MEQNNTVTKSIESLSRLLEGAKNGPQCSPLFMEGYIQGLGHALDMIKHIAKLEEGRIKFEAEVQAILNPVAS